MMFDAVFLDRDGVVNLDHGYVGTISRFEFCENALQGLKKLSCLTRHMFIVTNQSGIGRGFYTDTDFHELMNYLSRECNENGIVFSDFRYCPHVPSDGCSCRKPAPGMLLDLINEYGLDPKKCVLVGDNTSDIDAGRAAQIGYLVKLEKEVGNQIVNGTVNFKSLYHFAQHLLLNKKD